MKDIAVIARVPFDEGTLTGTLTLDSKWPAGDWRNGYFVPENLKSSVAHAEALRPLIPAGSTMAELALRFILTNPDVSTMIPGMRKLKNVEANCAASVAGPLSPICTRGFAGTAGTATPLRGRSERERAMSRGVKVQIYGQSYTIVGELEEAYVQQLAPTWTRRCSHHRDDFHGGHAEGGRACGAVHRRRVAQQPQEKGVREELLKEQAERCLTLVERALKQTE